MPRELAAALRDLARDPPDPDRLDSLDPRLVRAALPLVRLLLHRYFRADVAGLGRIPRGPALVVGNHNAGITFLEPFVMAASFYEQRGTEEPLHFLAHDAMVALPLLGRLLLKWGVVRAHPGTARRILQSGHKVVVFPGGNHEAFRPFGERYVVDFGGHLGFAHLAVALDVPVVPVANVGGHHSFVVLHRGEFLAKLLHTDRLLRSKAFPIALALPWGLSLGPIFHLPPPVKFDIEVGEPLQPSLALAQVPAHRRAQALYDLVTGRIQALVDGIRRRRHPGDE